MNCALKTGMEGVVITRHFLLLRTCMFQCACTSLRKKIDGSVGVVLLARIDQELRIDGGIILFFTCTYV
jgi:hypothetical protein